MHSYNSITCTGRGGDEQLNDGLMFCSSGQSGGGGSDECWEVTEGGAVEEK